MKKLFYITLLFLILSICISCGSKKKVTDTTTVKDSISTVTKIVPRDTLINLPGDSLNVKIPFYKLTEKPTLFSSEKGNIQGSVSRTGDTLIIDCFTDELQLQLEILDKIIESNRTLSTTTNTTEVIPEKYVPWWIKALAFVGGLVVIYILGLLGGKFIKPF
ncbi:hypothetical protein [Mesonia sp.]|uniref:hypothetical protein n=1 Tax=Mesonia sp. TaxID=1960830 RepID=UPI001779641D|nr:hypothetical protein [Mesonia sp.]HIB37976.1 hypothetical protein [Mesonia sp.]HIO26610.1 hypothetical protein [Flavobacteriaceae bacterium]